MYVYKIPEKYEKIMTKDFLEKFRDNIFRTFKGIGIDTPANDGIYNITSTMGWGTAFGITCIDTNNKELYIYYEGLSWMDSDVFDGLVAEKMIEESVILDDIKNLVNKYLNIEVGFCDKCSKLVEEKDLESINDEYICKECKGTKKESLKNYTNEVVKIIPKALADMGIKETIKCKDCNESFLNSEGIYSDNKFICKRCVDMEFEKGSTSKFYRNWTEQLERYKKSKK